MSSTRKPYPSDVCGEEQAFVAPYLVLLPDDVSLRRYPLREAWERPLLRREDGHPLAHAAPRPAALAGGPSADVAPDGGGLLRGRRPRPARARAPGGRPRDGGDLGQPDAAVDAGERGTAGLRRGQAPHGLQDAWAADTLGHLLELVVTPAYAWDRARVAELADALQAATGEAAAASPATTSGSPRSWRGCSPSSWPARYSRSCFISSQAPNTH